MPRSPEELQQVFDLGLITSVIEQRIGPLQAFIASGSITDVGKFDRNGINTSDIDCIAISQKNFKKDVSIPGWKIIPKKVDNTLEAISTIEGRTVHLRAFSSRRIEETLDIVLENIDRPLQELNMPLWVLAREMAEGVIIRGSLPDHEFFRLYNDPPTASHLEILKLTTPFYFNE